MSFNSFTLAVAAGALLFCGQTRAAEIDFTAVQAARTGVDPFDSLNCPFLQNNVDAVRVFASAAIGDSVTIVSGNARQPFGESILLLGDTAVTSDLNGPQLSLGGTFVASASSLTLVAANEWSGTLTLARAALGLAAGSSIGIDLRVGNLHTINVEGLLLQCGDVIGRITFTAPTTPPPAVPEPATLSLLALGLVAALRRRG